MWRNLWLVSSGGTTGNFTLRMPTVWSLGAAVVTGPSLWMASSGRTKATPMTSGLEEARGEEATGASGEEVPLGRANGERPCQLSQ